VNNLNIQVIESIIGYSFKDKNLLVQAFTHSSYANENNVTDYERLEFLGDSLLGCIAAEYLYGHYISDEGELTKIKSRLVSAKSLYKVMNELKLSKYILVGQSINRNKIPLNIVADVFESIVAGIYLDSDYGFASNFVNKYLIKSVENVNQILNELTDYKTKLQEVLQASGLKAVYVSKEENVELGGKFHIELLINDKVVASATANSKKDGERLCAKMFLENSGGYL